MNARVIKTGEILPVSETFDKVKFQGSWFTIRKDATGAPYFKVAHEGMLITILPDAYEKPKILIYMVDGNVVDVIANSDIEFILIEEDELHDDTITVNYKPIPDKYARKFAPLYLKPEGKESLYDETNRKAVYNELFVLNL